MKSFLDTDYYSFGVGQAVHQHFPFYRVCYKFIDRHNTVIENPTRFLAAFHEKLNEFNYINIKDDEIEYLRSQGVFTEEYLEFLKGYRFDTNSVYATIDDNGIFNLKIYDFWKSAIFWEVPLLATITELYLSGIKSNVRKHSEKLLSFREPLKDLDFCEFGTRRRRSFSYQDEAINVLMNEPGFKGTSNVHLAKHYNIPCLGTQSHQWYMAVSASVGASNANKKGLELWRETYGNKLGIALTDTYGTDNFLENFNYHLSNKYSGVRQDSGSPVDFAKKFHDHYTEMGIDPATKIMLFSDGLKPSDCPIIDAQLDTPLKRMYCMGTSLTNDHRLNIVMKLDTVNGMPVVKLSDEPGKNTGDGKAVVLVKEELGLYVY